MKDLLKTKHLVFYLLIIDVCVKANYDDSMKLIMLKVYLLKKKKKLYDTFLD